MSLNIKYDCWLAKDRMFSNSLFTNIVLQETFNICTNLLYHKVDAIEGINTSEFEKLLSLATQESYLTFNNTFYKQKDRVGLRLHLGLSLANSSLLIFELKWLEQCSSKFKPVFYQFFYLKEKKW